MARQSKQHAPFSRGKPVTADGDAVKVFRTKLVLPLFLALLALALQGGAPGTTSAHQAPSNWDNLIPGASTEEAGDSLSAAQSRALAGPAVQGVLQRRGLAVIADFSHTELEDCESCAINSVAKLSDQLAEMEAHWAWLSRGLEEFHWDILRVKLPVKLSENAYPSWAEYREAVATLAKQQVNIADYDANADGVIDTMWIMASNSGQNGVGYEYMYGGASRNADVNIFVDGQNTDSVVQGATGNFNHEVGHTLGLPDLYGTYDTLHYLTVMSDSWPVPPQDFTAYERSLLGWVSPTVVSRTNSRIHLLSADKYMQAIRVSTPRSFEYFLIEYRHRPDSSFGSTAPDYNGLAIYHVLETSSQSVDPPLVKLEPADGAIDPGVGPESDDFLFPENSAMSSPLVLRSYFGHQEVFQIKNVRWGGDNEVVFDIKLSSMKATQQSNLLLNPSFEQGTASDPDNWTPDAWQSTSTFTWEANVVKTGQRSVTISSSQANDARWIQTVSNLDPTKTYQLCGWLRGQNIVTGSDAEVGANVSILAGATTGDFTLSQSLSGTFDWTQTCVCFQPSGTSATLGCRLGFYGSTVTGQAWCDDLTLEPVESAF